MMPAHHAMLLFRDTTQGGGDVFGFVLVVVAVVHAMANTDLMIRRDGVVQQCVADGDKWRSSGGVFGDG